jgi:energy-coupling factor transporter ATP-binding protein EcfA2
MRTLPAAPRSPALAPAVPDAAVPAQRQPEPAPWPGREILAAPETARVLFAAWSGDPAVVVPSPPGAGKTRLVTLLAAAISHRAGMRVGVAAQTREQAVQIARRIGDLPGVRAKLLWPAKAPRANSGATPAVQGAQAGFPAEGGGVLIATTARWLFASPRDLGCDLMIVDEAWQSTYADLGALGAFAGQIVCVGDPGQIDPVVTGATTRWARAPHGPHLPAPDALRAAHGDAVAVIALQHTWRLGPATTALIQPAFYPELPFTSRRPPEHITGPAGLLPELAHRAVTTTAGPADAALTGACEQRVHDLLDGHALTTAEGTRALTAGDIAVVTAHVNQASAVRAMLADHPDVLVGTANQLQGLERHAVVVLHPLAGYRDLDSAFGADAGRACVMFSRHRAHLTVIADDLTPGVLARAAGHPAAALHAALFAGLLTAPAA